MLYHEGDPYRGMYVVLDGLAVVYKTSDGGRMLILHVCRPGDSFAETPLFAERPDRETHLACARATRDSEVLFLPHETFAPFLRRHPEVAWEMLKGFARRMRELAQQLENVTLREVTQRLARYLIAEMKAASVEHDPQPVLTLPIAKGSLASYLGTVHETLSRSFARLARDRILEVDGPRLRVLDPARLRRLA
jgi:CRP/FNR family transcriptional regulator